MLRKPTKGDTVACRRRNSLPPPAAPPPTPPPHHPSTIQGFEARGELLRFKRVVMLNHGVRVPLLDRRWVVRRRGDTPDALGTNELHGSGGEGGGGLQTRGQEQGKDEEYVLQVRGGAWMGSGLSKVVM